MTDEQSGNYGHPGDALGEWAQSMRSKGDGAKVIDLLRAIDDWMVVCHQQESQVERLEAALALWDEFSMDSGSMYESSLRYNIAKVTRQARELVGNGRSDPDA